jgi:hypothetical protein
VTDLVDSVDLAQSATSPVKPGESRHGRVAFIMVVVLTLIGAGLWALLPGAIAISQSKVLLDARPFTCKDRSDVTTYAQDDTASEDEQVYVPAIRLHPGLDCTIDVVVQNDSDVDIAVDLQGLTPAGRKDALDAVFDYENDPRSGGSYLLGAHSVQRFTFHLSWSNGCMDDGGAGIFTNAPTAVLSAGPWHIAKSWTGAGYAVIGGKNTLAASCNQ